MKTRASRFIMAMGAVSAVLQVQAFTVWTGQAGDDNWSSVSNWQTQVVGGMGDTDVRFSSPDKQGTITVDISPTLKTLNFYANVATNFVFSGNPITISNGTPTTTANLILNSSTNGYAHTFNNGINIISDGKFDRLNAGPGLVFNGAVSVIGADDIQIEAGSIAFNNTLSISNGVRFNTGETVFANQTGNQIGALVIVGSSSKVVVNTAEGVTFYDGAKIQHNQNNAAFTFNTANVLGDGTDINLNGRSATYTFNANEDLGFLKLSGTASAAGTLTVVVGDDVTALSFDSSSAQDWTNSVLVVSNFTSGVVQFGTNSNGLADYQLAAISAYDSGGAPVSPLFLDANGYLVDTLFEWPEAIGEVEMQILPGGADLVLGWDSTNLVPYAVQFTEDLMFGTWSNIVNVTGNGGYLSVTGAVDTANAFYRVILDQ